MSSTILLADDSLTIQKVVELTFSDTDYEVIAVSSGDELLEALPKCQPDIVICDVIMPGRDGYEICQDIKSDPQWLHLPVILLTGTFEPFDRDRALAAGCSEIVTKPFEAKKLVDAVERLSSAAGAPPPPSTADRSADATPGVSAPPPPPPDVAQPPPSEAGVEDTAVSAEWGPPAAAEPVTSHEVVEPADGGEPFEEPTHEASETAPPELEPEPEPPVSEPDFELDETAADEAEPVTAADDQTADEDEPFAELAPDGAETLASADISELTRGGADEVFEIPDGDAGEISSEVAGVGDPFAPEAADAVDDQVAADDTERTKTTPIDIESAMAGSEPELVEEHLHEIEAEPAEPQPGAEPPEIEAEPLEIEDEVPEIEEVADTPFETAQAEPTLEAEAMEPVFDAAEGEPSFELDTPGEPAAATEDEISNADTQDFAGQPPPGSDEEPAAANGGLSDSEVDRIARRILELAGDRIEKIAWDVIPDMAEIVVRERVREIEASSDVESH